MVVVRLRGGLGNQLFQYAAGRALAETHRTQLKLDLYTYTKHRYRKFELSKFKADVDIATREEVHWFTGSNPLLRFLNKRENYFRCPKVFAQPHYHFYEDFFLLPPDIYLSGYWQSERYFSSIADVIHNEYRPKVDLDDRNKDIQADMQSRNSVAVHVRRGDYASSSEYQSFFGVLDKSYYDKAIARIKETVAHPVFYFFSDDISWCRNNFSGPESRFIDHNTGDESYKDMLLMAACGHNIIANSTFSWWGAWLNQHTDKTVIAPGHWFRSNYLQRKEPVYPSRIYNTKDLIPPSWITL